MIFKAFNRIIKSDFDLQIPLSEGDVDILIQSKKLNLPKLHETKVFRNNTQALYGENGVSQFLVWPEQVSFEIIKNKIFYDASPNIDFGLLRVFMLSEALGIALANQNIFLLHGSAVNINNKATVFIGKPGMGKSATLAAFVASGFNIIADDMVAIEIIGTDIKVLPAFPELKIWKDAAQQLGFKTTEPAWEGKEKYLINKENIAFDPKPISLEQILIIQRPFSKVKKHIALFDKTIELVKYWPIPHQILRGKVLQRHFNNSLVLTQKIKIENFKRPANFDKLKKYVKTFL